MTRDPADAAAQPLIANEGVYAEHDIVREGAEGEYVEIEESELGSPGAFIWVLTVCAGISGLLFGYEYAFLKLSSLPSLQMPRALSPIPSSLMAWYSS
jgi:MFS transporter, SP family, solute carrier family 2 (myo-inositol transporter), member 13